MPRVGNITLTEDQKKRTFHLPVEQAVIVPSTSGVKNQTKISDARLNNRVNNVRRFMATRFGGFTDVKETGGFVLRNGKLVKERVVKVTGFATKEAFRKRQPEVIKQVGAWGKKWKQESVGYEHEGDLFIIEPPKNGSPKMMKKVMPSRKMRKVAVPTRRKVRITPARKKVMMANLAKARRVRARKRR